MGMVVVKWVCQPVTLWSKAVALAGLLIKRQGSYMIQSAYALLAVKMVPACLTGSSDPSILCRA